MKDNKFQGNEVKLMIQTIIGSMLIDAAGNAIELSIEISQEDSEASLNVSRDNEKAEMVIYKKRVKSAKSVKNCTCGDDENCGAYFSEFIIHLVDGFVASTFPKELVFITQFPLMLLGINQSPNDLIKVVAKFISVKDYLKEDVSNNTLLQQIIDCSNLDNQFTVTDEYCELIEKLSDTVKEASPRTFGIIDSIINESISESKNIDDLINDLLKDTGVDGSQN